MIPAALVGFSLGTLIAWWVVLRSLSHGDRDFDEADGMCPNCVTPWKCNGPHLADPLDEVQTVDPYVRRFFLDCE